MNSYENTEVEGTIMTIIGKAVRPPEYCPSLAVGEEIPVKRSTHRAEFLSHDTLREAVYQYPNSVI